MSEKYFTIIAMIIVTGLFIYLLPKVLNILLNKILIPFLHWLYLVVIKLPYITIKYLIEYFRYKF